MRGRFGHTPRLPGVGRARRLPAMKYISTRGGIAPLTFRETVMEGLARDGGLMLPERIPDVRRELVAWRNLPYAALACEVMSLSLIHI